MHARTLVLMPAVLALTLSTAAAQLPGIHDLSGVSILDAFGVSVAGLGDLNGDGFDDFAVSAKPMGMGIVEVHSGHDASLMYTLTGTHRSFGDAVDGIGDIDGDTIPDIIVGEPEFRAGPAARLGAVHLFSGASGAPLGSMTGIAGDDRLGLAVGSAGDVDGDGSLDYMFSAPGAINGRVAVISGATGGTLHTLNAPMGTVEWGRAIAGGGDVDGDGMDDVIISATTTAGNLGTVHVISGADGSTLHVFTSMNSVDFFGDAVANAGDVNGDGFDDVIVGAPQSTVQGPGFVSIFSGQSGMVLHSPVGDANFDGFGAAVAGGSDLNGDGRADYVVGAPSADSGAADGGLVRAFSGADGSVLADFTGERPGRTLGASVDIVGDVNADGFPDIAAGGPAFNLVAAAPGRAVVVTICGTRQYGPGANPTQTLDLGFIPDVGARRTAGVMRATGAAALAPGALAVSLGEDQFDLGGVDILVDPSALAAVPVTFSPSGKLFVPLDLFEPVVLAGFSLFFQVFEINPASPAGVFSSNGLQTLFCR